MILLKNTTFSQISKSPEQLIENRTQNQSQNFDRNEHRDKDYQRLCMNLAIDGEFKKIIASDNDEIFSSSIDNDKTLNPSILVNDQNKKSISNPKFDPDAPDTIIIQSKQNKLEFYDLSGHTKIWEFPMESEILFADVFAENRLLTISGNKQIKEESTSPVNYYLRLINLITGLPEQTSVISLPENVEIKYFGKDIAFYQNNRIVEKFSLTTDKLRQDELNDQNKNKLPEPPPDKVQVSEKSVSESRIRQNLLTDESVISSDEAGNIKNTANNGNLLWSMRVGGAVTGIIYEGKYIYISSKDNFVYLIELKSGKVKWKYRTAGRTKFGNIIFGNSLLIFDELKPAVIVIDKIKGKLRNLLNFANSRAITGQPVIARGQVFVPTDQGLYSLAPCPAKN